MKSSTWMVLGKRKSPLPQRPIPNTKTELETNTASGVHTGGTSGIRGKSGNKDSRPVRCMGLAFLVLTYADAREC